MRQQNLSAVKAGITRLRDKGGASPDSLYDLLNGYVTAARTIKCRPGTRIEVVLPPGTKGLVWFQGKFVVFSHLVVDSGTSRVEVEVIRHPTAPATPIKDIHFALPFLGYLYVVAEFADGLIRHYWLEKGEVWQPNHIYLPGTLVRPTEGNGMAYRVESDRAGYTPWAPNVGRALGDVVVPVVDNGYLVQHDTIKEDYYAHSRQNEDVCYDMSTSLDREGIWWGSENDAYLKPVFTKTTAELMQPYVGYWSSGEDYWLRIYAGTHWDTVDAGGEIINTGDADHREEEVILYMVGYGYAGSLVLQADGSLKNSEDRMVFSPVAEADIPAAARADLG